MPLPNESGRKEIEWKHSVSGKILVRADKKYSMDGLGQSFSAAFAVELSLKIEARKEQFRIFQRR
jgi:hypothetical protein